MDRNRGNVASLAASIIVREFKRARPSAFNVRARLRGDGETIDVEADGVLYTMFVGSDDDGFVFWSSEGESVAFDFPGDWLALLSDGS